MPFNYPERSLQIQARLNRLGLTTDRLKLIGAFIVAYGIFETTLERALWALGETSIAGVRPFTEKMRAEDQFKMLGAGNLKLSVECNEVLAIAALAAEDLNEYRNSLVHGYLLAFPDGGTPSFMKNPGWQGVKRNKAVGDAYIEEPFQDLVLIAAWTLSTLVQHIERCFAEPQSQRAIVDMKVEVGRARSYASEARHLRALMNHEKY